MKKIHSLLLAFLFLLVIAAYFSSRYVVICSVNSSVLCSDSLFISADNSGAVYSSGYITDNKEIINKLSDSVDMQDMKIKNIDNNLTVVQGTCRGQNLQVAYRTYSDGSTFVAAGSPYITIGY